MQYQVLLVLLLVGSGWPSFPPPVLWVEPEGSGSSLSLQELRDQLELRGKFDLQLHRLQLQCDVSSALRSLFDSLWAEPNYLLLLGGACPQVNAVIGRALPALGLVQVSYEAPPPSGKKWEGLFSMAPSFKNQNRAIVRLLQEHHWTRVGVLAQDRRSQTQMKEDLVRQMLKVGLQVDHLRVSEDICSGLRTLKLQTEDTDVRTIVALIEDQDADDFFCCAYRLNLVSPQYQWLLIGPTDRRASTVCSEDHEGTASDKSVIVRTRHTGQDLLHDLLLVGGGALSHVTKELRRERWGDPTNQRRDTRRLLMEALRRTHFIGRTGLVSFYQGERMSWIDLIQFQGNSSVLVGNFSTRTQQLHLNSKLHFNEPTGPTSSFLLLFILSSSAAAIILIILSISILLTRGRRWDLDLPLLLCSSSVLLSGLEETFHLKHDFLCSARLWTLSLGHTGVLTVLIHRSWKIYSLRNTDGKTPPPGTWMLGPALLDLLLLTLRWAVLQGHTERQAQMLIGPFYERWIAATCSFKAPLTVLGCVLAWTIRRDPAGRPLTFSLLCVMVFSQSGLVVHLLRTRSDVSALLVMGCVIIVLLSTSTPEVRQLWDEDDEDDEDEELQCVENLHLRTVELDCEIESISLQLYLTEQTNGVHSSSSSSSSSFADVQVYSHSKNTTSPDPNSPEHVRRRLSLQLPILHHSYLPVVGGLRCSSSNQTLDGTSHD